MGDFFEDLGKKITETADMLTKKTEKVMEIQKLQNQIRNLERANERDFRDLGRMVYVAYKTDGDVKEPYRELCENIKQREENIDDMKDQLEELRGSGKCPQCGASVQENMSFCPQCGAKIVKEAEEEDIFEDEEIPSEDAAEEEQCSCEAAQSECGCQTAQDGCSCGCEEAEKKAEEESAKEQEEVTEEQEAGCEKKECESGE